MKKPVKRTTLAFAWDNSTIGLKYLGLLTCECTGEWSDHVKSWTEINNPCGNQYSLHRNTDNKYYFILECTP